MKTNVRESSLQAHDAIQADGTATTKRARIEAWIRLHPRCSRQDIAQGTRISINCVCGRVGELLEDEAVFERALDKEDPISHKRVNTLEAMPIQGALDLEAA